MSDELVERWLRTNPTELRVLLAGHFVIEQSETQPDLSFCSCGARLIGFKGRHDHLAGVLSCYFNAKVSFYEEAVAEQQRQALWP